MDAVSSPPAGPVELASAQLHRVTELARQLAVLLCQQDEHFRRTDPGELRAVFEVNLREAFTAVVDGHELNTETARKTGLTQARLGIPLPAALRAFRISGTFIYEAMVEHLEPGSIGPEQLVALSTAVWRIVDRYSDALADAYAEIDLESSSNHGKLRLDRLDAILEGRLSGAELEHAARILGIQQFGTFVVLVVDHQPRCGQPGDGAVRLRLPAVWRPGDDSDLAIVSLSRTASAAQLRHSLSGLTVGVGISRPISSLAAVPGAVQQARIARRSAPDGGVAVFGELPVSTLVAGAPGLAAELARDVLAAVLGLPDAERTVLLRTLQEWFAVAGSARDAAENLFVHPNTVRYRIRRIQDLTGRDLTHPRAIAELYVAIEAIRIESP